MRSKAQPQKPHMYLASMMFCDAICVFKGPFYIAFNRFLTCTPGLVGYEKLTSLNWIVLSNFSGTSPSSEEESMGGC